MSLARARARYLAVIALAAAGCEERERWPEPERERPRPGAITPAGEVDCNHGVHCGPATGEPPGAPAPPPHAECAYAIPIPPAAASGVALAAVPQLRVRFDPEATLAERARAPAGRAPCCYRWFEHCRGRPLLIEDRPALARARRRADWAAAPASAGGSIAAGSPADRRRLAAHWRREAAYEHASIASFSRLALDLIALGAPLELVVDSQRAAADELAHARVAYGLATRFGGRPVGPGRLELPAPGPVSLASLAGDTWAQGCAIETVAAAIARETASRAAPPLRRVLGAIARDEARHAALAWRVAAWALAAGGEPARRAIAASAERLARGLPAEPRRRAPAGSALERHGLLGREARSRTASAAWNEVVLPCTEALLSAPRAGARARRSRRR